MPHSKQLSSVMNVRGKKTSRVEEPISHSKLPHSTSLSNVSMLGSHDAGTYAYSKKYNAAGTSMGKYLPAFFKTQKLTLRQQAENHTRYFDIRVARRNDGTFAFFHGPSKTGSDAVEDVRALLEFAEENKDDFFLLKFVFKNENNAMITNGITHDAFLDAVLEGHHDSLITEKEAKSPGEATVELLTKSKNILIMVNEYHGRKQHWAYKDHTHTKWANTANAKKTADFLRSFHGTPPPPGKLMIIQTNIPAMSLGKMQITAGIKKFLSQNKDFLSSAIQDIEHPGIISADYIGDKAGATDDFLEKVNANNKKLLEG